MDEETVVKRCVDAILTVLILIVLYFYRASRATVHDVVRENVVRDRQHVASQNTDRRRVRRRAVSQPNHPVKHKPVLPSPCSPSPISVLCSSSFIEEDDSDIPWTTVEKHRKRWYSDC